MSSTTARPLDAALPFPRKPLVQLIHHGLAAGLLVAAAGAGAQTDGREAQLGSVTITDQAEAIGNLQKTYSGGQFARGGDLGVLGRTDLMNVPFSTTNYTAELIRNQQGITVSDVVMNDASVRTLQARGGFGDDYQIRGFTLNARNVGVNGLYGLAPSTRMPVELVERVEVLKGPAAFANGIGPVNSIGGSINTVTKRAGDVPLTRLTGTYMGKAQFGTHLDVGRRFGEDNEWGVRANGLWRNGEGNINDGRQRVGLGSLGVDYTSGRVRWSGDLIYIDGKTVSFRPQPGFLSGITQVPAVPDPRVSFYPGATLTDKTKTAITRLEYDISDRTTVYGGIGYTETDSNQNFPTATTRVNSAGAFRVANGYYDEYNKTTAGDLGVRTRFVTGPVNHTLVAVVNGLERETGYFYQLGTNSVASSIYNPAPLPAITFARGTPGRSQETSNHSFAVADTLGLLNDRLLLTLGLRRQTISQDSYNPTTGAFLSNLKGTSTSPLVGVVFKPEKNTSVYYNYTAGLQSGGRAPVGQGLINEGAVFAPQKSKQHEIGVKRDWGTLITQAAVYQIEQPSAITENNVYSFGGKQRNRGLELTAYGEAVRGLRVMASASFTDAQLVRTAGGTNQGKDAPGVPPRTYNAGVDWDTPWVPGVSLNGRVISTASTYYDAANLLRLPAWTRVDVGARYTTRVANKPVVLRANLENISDKRYWVVAGGYATVGAPRTLMLSASVDF